MRQRLSESALSWAAGSVGADARIVAVKGLRRGSSPWWLRVEHGATTHELVLRVAGWIQPRQIVTGATALRAAEEYGLPAPRLIAADLDGRVTGVPATLETALPGTRAIPAKASAERLREVGAAIAKVHAIPLDPRPDLPLRVRPRTYDYALGRRWATLYHATADSEKALVVDALCELTGWSADRGLYAVTSTLRRHCCSSQMIGSGNWTDRTAQPSWCTATPGPTT
jgi:hypothetical protein